jgi:hypothetical protein
MCNRYLSYDKEVDTMVHQVIMQQVRAFSICIHYHVKYALKKRSLL